MSGYSIDLSTNGRDLKRVYDAIVSSDPEISWGVFTYGAGQSNALRVSAEGADSLDDFCEEFDDGKVQYGFARVDYNNIAKFVLVGWVGEGVPERTKGYFNAHFSTVAKYFHGYHVQITARSSGDLSPAIILQKVDQASGSKYSGATKKAVPLRPSYRAAKEGAAEEDWGDAKPVVEKDELNKVESAYKPTKVDISSIRSQPSSTTRSVSGAERSGGKGPVGTSADKPEVVRGSYQPVGKVDINALRAQAKDSKFKDDGPAPLQSSYKPIGKVDINAIRAAASKKDAKSDPAPAPKQDTKPVSKPPAPAAAADNDDEEEDLSGRPVSERMKAFGGTVAAGHGQDDDEDTSGKSVKERMAAFSGGSGRLTELPKPRPSGSVASRFKPATSSTGTAPALPKDVFSSEPRRAASGISRDFGSVGGKTPAQLWAEKHGKAAPSAPAHTQQTAAVNNDEPEDEERKTDISNLRSQFENKASISDEPASKHEEPEQEENEPRTSFADITSRFAAKSESPQPPSQPQRSLPPPAAPAAAASRAVPPPPPAREPEPEPEPELEKEAEQEPEEPAPPSLPSRSAAPEPEPESEPAAPALPSRVAADEPAPATTSQSVSAVVLFDYEKDEDNEIALVEGELITNIDKVDADWWIGTNSKGETGLFPSNYVEEAAEGASAGASAPSTTEPAAPGPGSEPTSASAVAEYDYDAEEEGELTFKEGDIITDISFDDDAWWSGVVDGVRGLFPSNYVQLRD